MSEQLKKSFASLDEAIATLPKKTYDHSVRVSAYLRLIFLQGCAAEIYRDDPKAVTRLKEEYAGLSEVVGLCHDVGKAMLPEEYQNVGRDFAPEEITLYQKHVVYSQHLMEKHFDGNKDLKLKPFQESTIREAIAFHHENWDGSGFPNMLSGKHIPIIARMLSLADKMDHWFCETHSEDPFNDTLTRIYNESGKMFDPEIVALIKPISKKIKKIFKENISCTRSIDPIISFVHPLTPRPFALFYRPIENRETREVVGCEASIKFKTSKLWLDYKDAEHIIKKDQKMRRDLGVYTTLEACDFIRRLDNCKIPLGTLAINYPSGWMNVKGTAKDIIGVLTDSGVSPQRLCVVLSKSDFSARRTILKDNVAKLKAAGCSVMFSGLSFKGIEPPPPPELDENGNEINPLPEKLPDDRVRELKRAEEKAAKEKAARESEEADSNVSGLYEEVIYVESEEDKKKSADKILPGVVTYDEVSDFNISAYRITADEIPLFDVDEYIELLKKMLDAGIMLSADGIERDKYEGLLNYLEVEEQTGELVGRAVPADDYVRSGLIALDEAETTRY